MSLLSFFTLNYSAQMLIIGHRGASGYEPENTLRSFSKAISMGVDIIELDVHACATGELVIHHDDNVHRTTNGRGNVANMTFTDLRQLKIAGSEQIPTLSEVINLVDKQVPINIELKGLDVAKPVAELIKKYMLRGWKGDDFIVSSFNHAQVREFKSLCPTIKTGLLFSRKEIPSKIISIAQKHQANFIGLDTKTVTKDLVQIAHQAKFSVFVWTVNNKKTAYKLRSYNVDGIFTNYPDRVKNNT